MEYASKKPYPTPRVLGKNKEYATLLSASYAGMISEQTAIHQYLYQSFVLEPDVSTILHHISIVEMHHFELLAETIKLLGTLPKYQSYSTTDVALPWTASYVPYPETLEEMLETDLRSEETAIHNYQVLIEEIKDPYIKELIERIIEDEYLHVKIFQTLLKRKTEKN